jgi:septum formation inhibitor MinC
VPQFCHNWHTFSAKPKVNIDTTSIAAKLVPVPHHQLLCAAQRTYSASAPASPSRTLRERKTKVNYKALHLGQAIKQDIQHAAQDVMQKCKSMSKSVRKSTQAAVTKLVPGAFSPKQPPPASAPSSPCPSSSSAWTFWPSK